MIRLIRFLITGFWPSAASYRSLAKRLAAVEEDLAGLALSHRKLQGRLTGGLRGVPIVGGEPHDDDGDFPDEAFDRLEREIRGPVHTTTEQEDDDE